jgi:arsenate reductase (thioredoxin)
VPESTRVLFVCLHGAAKSVIAAEYLRLLAARRGIRIETSAAGVEPDVEIPPTVVSSLLAEGVDVRGRQPIAVQREMLERADRVVSFGCDLSDVAPGGAVVTEWMDVPAVSDGYVTARDEIVRRVTLLLEDLVSPSAEPISRGDRSIR